MEQYETEEQQLDALKKWWKENASAVILGLALGVSGLFGWQYYTQQKNNHAVIASDIYGQIMQNVKLNTVDDKTQDLANTLINDYADTPYTSLAAMALAKVEYEKDEIKQAQNQLAIAIQYAHDDVTKQTANLRLVKVYIEEKSYDKALNSLSLTHGKSYNAIYQELTGDVYNAKGEFQKARKAYDKAIQGQGFQVERWLKLKRQNLGTDKKDNLATAK